MDPTVPPHDAHHQAPDPVREERDRLRLQLRHIESLNTISQAIEQTLDLELMIQQVMWRILEIFEGDRAYLLHPADPASPVFRVPIEVTRPEWPGAFAMGIDLPMDPTARALVRHVLDSDGPVVSSLTTPVRWDPDLMRQFGIKSQIQVAIRPRIGQPWLLGVHQCAYERVWTEDEVRLLRDVAYRLRDAFTNLLYHRELKRSEEKYRSVVDSIREVIARTDEFGRMTFLNEAWARMTGRPVAEGLGERFIDAFHPEDRARLEALRDQASAEGRSETSFEARLTTADGGFRWIEGHLRVLYDAQRGYRGCYATLVDETERREADAARAEVRAARELDQIKTNFVNAVSHDLRTPLTSILGYAEFLDDEIAGPLSREQREFVAQIEKSAYRLEHLVDDLLDVARLEAGTFNLRLEDAELGAKMREVVESLRPQAQEARLVLALSLPEAPLRLRMDVARVERALTNLIANAIKFTPEGGRITVRAIPEDGHVRCEVTDTGIGIAPEELPRLFRLFSQASGGLRKGGTGLGLSITKSIVEAHGGQVGVESAPGQGSTFWFTLPLGAAG